MLRKLGNKAQLLLFAIVLGIGPTIFGAHMLHQQNEYVKTTAVITQVNETYNGASEDYDYEVYVTYEVDGKTYNEELPYYQDGYIEGKEVNIAYNEDNPSEITTGEKGFGIYLVIIGPIIFIGCIVKIILGR